MQKKRCYERKPNLDETEDSDDGVVNDGVLLAGDNVGAEENWAAVVAAVVDCVTIVLLLLFIDEGRVGWAGAGADERTGGGGSVSSSDDSSVPSNSDTVVASDRFSWVKLTETK